VSGKLSNSRTYEKTLEVTLPADQGDNSVLSTLWARKRIGEIELLGSGLFEANAYTPDAAKEEITRLGLAYKIMTKYTSFVAVDDAIRNKDGKWIVVEQPVEMPEGTAYASQPANRFAEGKAKSLMRVYAYKGSEAAGVKALDDVVGSVSGLKASRMATSQSPAAIPVEVILSKDSLGPEDALMGRSYSELRQEIINRFLSGLEMIYHNRLRSNPGLTGRIKVHFRVMAHGETVNVSIIKSSFKDAAFEKALIERIGAWRFEECGRCGDARVSFELVFSRK
jgi:Ca-activated chloride channel homolog